MSWLDPQWRYWSAASHSDLALFAARQRERRERAAAAPRLEWAGEIAASLRLAAKQGERHDDNA